MNKLVYFVLFTILAGQMFDIEPAHSHIDEDITIELNLIPSSIESTMSGFGYVSIVNKTNDLPIIATNDLEIRLSSQNASVASVPYTVVISKGQQYAKFNVNVLQEGTTEISASYNDDIVSQELRVVDVYDTIPENIQLSINIPSSEMRIDTSMPLSVYLHDNDTLLAAPRDIVISLNYDRDLIKLEDEKLVIKQGNYYALTTIHAKKEGNSYIRATIQGEKSTSLATLSIRSDTPSSLKVYAFPNQIPVSEKTIDLFIGLLDSNGLPVKAHDDIPITLFSNSTMLSNSFIRTFSTNNPIIKKGEYGLHLRQPIFLISNEDILVGASASGLRSNYTAIKVVDQLSARDPKSSFQVLTMDTISSMPTNSKAIVIYQLNAIERDYDDCPDYIQTMVMNVTIMNTCTAQGFRNIHPIDLLDDGSLYPIETTIIHSKERPYPTLVIDSSDTNILRISNPGIMSVGSSYGVAVISSQEKTGDAVISVSLQGIGMAANQTSVINTQTIDSIKIFSPVGEGRLIQDREGYYELFIITLDTLGRPFSSKSMDYVISPINELLSIKPDVPFAKLRFASMLLPSDQDDISIKALPIGIDSQDEFGAEASLKLIRHSGVKLRMELIAQLIGFNKADHIGVIQLIDPFDNPVPASSDLVIKLDSNKDELVRVPSYVTIPKGSSFTEFSLTTFNKDGNVTISAINDDILQAEKEIGINLEQISADIIREDEIPTIVPSNITISTIEEVNITWLPSKEIEIVGTESIYHQESSSYISTLTFIPKDIGTVTVKAILSKDGYHIKEIVEDIAVKEYSPVLNVNIVYPDTTIPYNATTPIDVIVYDKYTGPVSGAYLLVSGDEIKVKRNAITDDEGKATIEVRTTAFPRTSLSVIASKEGYVEGESLLQLNVTGLPDKDSISVKSKNEGTSSSSTSWVLYPVIAGILGMVGVGIVFMMFRKPKKSNEEDEYDDEVV